MSKRKRTQPMQPVERAADGCVRFRSNAIVKKMLEWGEQGERFDLNRLAREKFTVHDEMQIAQLIGYSVSGFYSLSYVTPKAASKAEKKLARLLEKENAGRRR